MAYKVLNCYLMIRYITVIKNVKYMLILKIVMLFQCRYMYGLIDKYNNICTIQYF